jgi:hypothetical protein
MTSPPGFRDFRKHKAREKWPMRPRFDDTISIMHGQRDPLFSGNFGAEQYRNMYTQHVYRGYWDSRCRYRNPICK